MSLKYHLIVPNRHHQTRPHRTRNSNNLGLSLSLSLSAPDPSGVHKKCSHIVFETQRERNF
jgi:hypothetical protein